MKERPILFSAPMVRAILEGRKSMTRRIVKPKLTTIQTTLVDWNTAESAWVPWAWADNVGYHAGGSRTGKPFLCPYGIPGDRLWVKETFAHWSPKIIKYRADGECSDGDRREHYTPGKWRPSIFMPRWASRILLEITNIRVERLQDISEEDAKAEGAPSADLASGREVIFPQDGTHIWGFRLLWESINGPGSWEANPWVWVVEFPRIKA